MSDDALMEAATNNRSVALFRIEKGHLGTPPGFIDVLNEVPGDDVDAIVAEVHGNVQYGNKAEARQAYEVLACATPWSVTEGRSTTSTRVFTLGRSCSRSTR